MNLKSYYWTFTLFSYGVVYVSASETNKLNPLFLYTIMLLSLNLLGGGIQAWQNILHRPKIIKNWIVKISYKLSFPASTKNKAPDTSKPLSLIAKFDISRTRWLWVYLYTEDFEPLNRHSWTLLSAWFFID